MSPGQAVTAAIRPEDIDAEDVAEDGAEGGAGNIIEVEIVAMEFLGSFYRATFGGAAVDGLGIRADFSINLVRRKNVVVGSRLPVRFPARFIRVYAGD